MRRFGRSCLALVAMVAATWTAIAASSIEGRWRLAEQRYENGRADLVRGDEPLHLEFSFVGGELRGKAWSGSRREAARDWPAVGPPGDGRSVEIERFEKGAGRVKVHYRVDPVAGDDLYLDITEDYRVTADGRFLVGTATVVFRRGAQQKGSYTLHRRFERAP